MKRAELDKSKRNHTIVIRDENHRLFRDFKRYCGGPNESKLPLKLVESNKPMGIVKDISTGERIGSTEYSPAVLAATSWRTDYDLFIYGLEEDAQHFIKKRVRIINYVGTFFIVLGTLVTAYSGLMG